MMQKIREGKLGKALADVVSDEFVTNKSFEEVLEIAEEEYNLKTQKTEQELKRVLEIAEEKYNLKTQKIEQELNRVIKQENIKEDYLYNVDIPEDLNYL